MARLVSETSGGSSLRSLSLRTCVSRFPLLRFVLEERTCGLVTVTGPENPTRVSDSSSKEASETTHTHTKPHTRSLLEQ